MAIKQIGLIAVLLLSGCGQMTPQQRTAFGRAMLTSDQNFFKAYGEATQAAYGVPNQQNNAPTQTTTPAPAPMPTVQHPVNTYCYQIGNQVNCTTQ